MIELKNLPRREGGYTIAEMMVVMLILSLLVGTFYAFLYGGDRAAKDGRDWLELNQSARLVFERVTRELREADVIREVYSNASGDDGAWGIKFSGDLNQNGTFVTGTYVPTYDSDETIVYRYDPSLTALTIATEITPTALPLVDHISSFKLTYFGSDPRTDVGCSPEWSPVPAGCVASDGIITWQEVDNAINHGVSGFGNGNKVLDAPEFPNITSIVVDMTVAIRFEKHNYRTAVELRNLFK